MAQRLQVLLLPGLLCDATVWAAQVSALKPFAEVKVADLSQHDSLRDMADSALALWDSPFVVIGHSMGARVALELVRMAPDRVVKLALIDTGAHPRQEGEEAKRQVLVDLAFEQGMGALADLWLPPMVDQARVDDADLIARLREMVMRATPARRATASIENGSPSSPSSRSRAAVRIFSRPASTDLLRSPDR